MQGGTFVVRTTASNPLTLASLMRNEIPRARPEFRVSNMRTQQQLIEAQTIRERLPEGFQRAEYLQAHGMVDMVVSRLEMRSTLARLCALLTKAPPKALAQAA